MIWTLHGAVGSVDDWADLGTDSALGEIIRPVDLYDLLEAGGDSLSEAAGGLRKLVEASGDADPVVLGYSMGGRIALHALVRDADFWRRAVIVSAHSGLNDERERAERRTADDAWAQRARELPWREFLDGWSNQPVLADGPTARGMRPVTESRRASVASSLEAWSLGRQDYLTPALARAASPTLWITGELDEKFTRLARSACAVMASARHVVLPGAGHRAPWQNPSGFRAAVREFVLTAGDVR